VLGVGTLLDLGGPRVGAGVGDGAVLELESRCLGSSMKLSAGIGDGWRAELLLEARPGTGLVLELRVGLVFWAGFRDKGGVRVEGQALEGQALAVRSMVRLSACVGVGWWSGVGVECSGWM
jgi:hypothetical protein